MSDDEFDDWLKSRSEIMTQGLTVAKIASLTDEQLDNEIWNVLSDTDMGTLGTLPPEARAFFATKTFESEVANGGLHQFFFNHPNPLIHEAVIEGYETLGLSHRARQVREVILPAADAEKVWRASLAHDSSFFDSHKNSRLRGLDELVGDHVAARCGLVRANPSAFTVSAD